MAKKDAVRVTPSTGNVFRDLGFSKEESEHLLVRADLLIQVQKAIASRRLKQAEAAKVLRVTQPRVSDLLRGRIDLFSTDALIDMLARLGVGVRLVVKPASEEGRMTHMLNRRTFVKQASAVSCSRVLHAVVEIAHWRRARDRRDLERQGSRRSGRDRQRLQRHSVRRTDERQEPLHAASQARSLDRHARCARLRSNRAAGG